MAVPARSPGSTLDGDFYDAASQPPQLDLGGETPWPMPHELAQIAGLSKAVAKIVAAGDVDIPVFPALAQRILNIMDDPDPDILEVVRVIVCEPAVAAEMLRVANSSMYSRGQHIANIRDAVVRLGSAEACRLTVAIATRDLFRTGRDALDKRFAGHIQQLWYHAVVCSFSSAALAAMSQCGAVEQAFTCGLLHDLGKAVGIRCLAQASRNSGIELTDRLVEFVLDDVHGKQGAVLAKQQELPDFIAEVCGRHHDGTVGGEPESQNIHIIRVVSGYDDLRTGSQIRPRLADEIDASATVLGLDDFDIARLRLTLEQTAEKTAAMISAV